MTAYEYDIFISYRRLEAVQYWVEDIFYPELCDWLHAHLGIPKDRVFWDNSAIEYGSDIPDSIVKALQSSKVMLALWTNPYFSESAWCATELSAFRKREEFLKLGKGSLILPIALVDCNDKDLPTTETGTKILCFRDLYFPPVVNGRGVRSSPFKDSHRYLVFQEKIKELVVKLITPRLDSCPTWREFPCDILTSPLKEKKLQFMKMNP